MCRQTTPRPRATEERGDPHPFIGLRNKGGGASRRLAVLNAVAAVASHDPGPERAVLAQTPLPVSAEVTEQEAAEIGSAEPQPGAAVQGGVQQAGQVLQIHLKD